MRFEVVQKGQINRTFKEDVVYLYKDGWNDWFHYYTLFHLHYLDKDGEQHELGSLKIGQRNMTSGIPEVPTVFERLEEDFFSLGQSEDYYENIKKLEHGELRQDILESLRDIAYDLDLYSAVAQEDVTLESLMRDVNETVLKGQFHRIARGGAKLTAYDISYKLAGQARTNYQLEFHVVPNSSPPTNIHVLIGRNGVGKTHMLLSMIHCLSHGNQDERYGRFSLTSNTKFSNFVCVAFSPFDSYPAPDELGDHVKHREKYTYIGLGNNKETRLEKLENQFIASLNSCSKYKEKRTLWTEIVELLNSDPMFENNGFSDLLNRKYESQEELISMASELFRHLSSGHKVILLTLTCLISVAVERTLVLIDEPENHLHPPLLSAFTRALSALLIRKNGLAIISTHSPVILQEVPKSCVWRLSRQGTILRAERLDRETFGENVGILTNEIFGLEVTHSGFHKMLLDMVNEGLAYDEILERFDSEIGTEAKAIIRTLVSNREAGNN